MIKVKELINIVTLKPNMYVRFKDKNGVQYIRKIVELPEDVRYGSIKVDKDIYNSCAVSKKNVLKVSFDLIGLIKVGDYVNGEKVTETMIKMRDEQGVFGLPDHYRMFVDEIHIKSVVTREQFESMKYIVERNDK